MTVWEYTTYLTARVEPLESGFSATRG